MHSIRIPDDSLCLYNIFRKILEKYKQKIVEGCSIINDNINDSLINGCKLLFISPINLLFSLPQHENKNLNKF